MKKIVILSALLAGALFCEAQTVSDGLIYGQQDNLFGTARYRGMSGAFGALGGDLTAMGQNPAGSSIFNNHYASVTAAYQDKQNTGNYFNGLITSDDNDLNFSQFGGVLVFKSTGDNLLTKFAFGINYDATRQYDDFTRIRGTSNTSISSYFLNNANGFAESNFETLAGESVTSLYRFLGEEPGLGFQAQQGFLGYQAFIIDPAAAPNTDNIYVSNTGTGVYTQQNDVVSSGSQSKTSFNVSGQLADKWSVGLNLNGHSIDYTRFSAFREANNNSNATISRVDFDNTLSTNATGFSFQLGAIGKLTESLRVGATYESPTWYNVEETLFQQVRSTSTSGDFVRVAPDVINVYEPYNLRTPSIVTGSVAYIFGTKGLISVDYSTQDYSNLQFETGFNQNFDGNNNFIDQNLERANTLRIGGEYRIDRLSLRGGYRMIGSPYEDKSIMDDVNGYSLGLGYSWGGTTLDLSYDYSERTYAQQLFDSGLTSRGTINNETSNVVISLGFNF